MKLCSYRNPMESPTKIIRNSGLLHCLLNLTPKPQERNVSTRLLPAFNMNHERKHSTRASQTAWPWYGVGTGPGEGGVPVSVNGWPVGLDQNGTSENCKMVPELAEALTPYENPTTSLQISYEQGWVSVCYFGVGPVWRETCCPPTRSPCE